MYCRSAGGAPQNPTTVQITIHQPKQTTSSAGGVSGSERLVQNAAHPHFTSNQSASLAVSAPGSQVHHPPQQQPVLQKLVISQTPSGQIQQNRTTSMCYNKNYFCDLRINYFYWIR